MVADKDGQSTTWRRVQSHFSKEFKNWASQERTEANTSGAEGSFNALDLLFTTIQKEKAAGLGKNRDKKKKNHLATRLDVHHVMSYKECWTRRLGP